ncbi:MAG: arylesterase [Bacteroidota bacterium]
MTILFFGNSLTAGYGLDETEAFPYLIQTRIDSLGLPYQVVNGGLSGETTAGGKGRIDWVLRSPVDIFVLELGANDMLRGLDLSETDKNLRAILDKVRKANARTKIVIAGMQAPPNMGKDYQDNFAAIFGQVAKDYDASLIPFLLAGLEGKGLDIGDGKHPNAEGQLIVMENVWSTLKDLL